jgi:hypothetical protein
VNNERVVCGHIQELTLHISVRLWSRLWSHYHPRRLLYRVFSGGYLEVIPRYSIRYGIAEAHLNESMRGVRDGAVF